MANQWSAEKMLALGSRHAQLEAECDLDGVMATLVADPVYEIWPIGLRARGQDAVRRYYEHLLEVFIPTQRSYRLVEEWLSERSLAQEYEIEINGPDGPVTHQVIGILWAEGELMGGERVWGSESCLRAMVGPLFDELEPIRPLKRPA
jgi:hypothetical protein